MNDDLLGSVRAKPAAEQRVHILQIITGKFKIGMTIKNELVNSVFPDSDPASTATGHAEPNSH